MTSRETLLAETFVELADTLVDDYDVIDFLHLLARRTSELLDAEAAGIMMADQRGGLQVMASSAEEARLLELYELQSNEGPCLECYHSGSVVSLDSPTAMTLRWPTFTPRLRELGFSCAQAIPLRLRHETIGALNIFSTDPQGVPPHGLRLGQALADVATVGLLQEQAIAARELLAEQLQTALNSRIVLEQAKGVLAERAGLEMNVAFEAMRSYARRRGLSLVKVAEEVITGRLDDVGREGRAPTSPAAVARRLRAPADTTGQLSHRRGPGNFADPPTPAASATAADGRGSGRRV